MRIEATAMAASPIRKAVAIAAPGLPDVARRRPAAAGPSSVPRPSVALEAMFDATSSPGDRTSQGNRLMVSGRVSPAKPASNATRRKSSQSGAPSVMTPIDRTMQAARVTSTPSSRRSVRQRAAGRPANGDTSAGGTYLTTPSHPAATAPPLP